MPPLRSRLCGHQPRHSWLTCERVLIHADTGVHPDLLSSRFGYVAVSHASHEAIIFTDDANRLAQQLGTEVTKPSALELVQTESIGGDSEPAWGFDGCKR